MNPLQTTEGRKFIREIRERRDIDVKEKNKLIDQFIKNFDSLDVEPVVKPEPEPVVESEPEPVAEPEPVEEPVSEPAPVEEEPVAEPVVPEESSEDEIVY